MLAYRSASNTCSETTNMVYGFSRFLSVAIEVKSEFMLEDLGILQNIVNFQKIQLLYNIVQKDNALIRFFKSFFADLLKN